MKRHSKIVLAGALALGLAGAGVAAIADGGLGGHGFGPGKHMCERDMAMKADMLEVYLESRLDLNEEQLPAWNGAIDAINAAMAARDEACAAARVDGKPATTVEALARAETWMTSGLEHVRTIRAAVDNLYQVLDAEQRTTLDTLLLEFHQMRG